MPLPPGSQASVLVQTWEWLRRPTELLDRCARQHGATFALSVVGLGPMVVVSSPADVRRLFAAGPDEVCQPRNTRFLAALGPSSLLLLNGDEHLRHRRLLLSALRTRTGPQLQRDLAQLHEHHLATWPVGSPMQLLGSLQELTRRSMVQRLFGDSDGDPALADAICKLCAGASEVTSDPLTVLPLSVQRLLGQRSPWARALELLRQGNQHLYRAIARRRRARDLSSRHDVLSQLILARDEQGRRLGDADLRDELFTLLIAGIDTTAIVLAWALHELLRRPELLARLQRQVRSLRQRDGLLDCDALDRLPLLDATLRETLRLWPVFPILARQLLRPMRLQAGELPAGTRVVLCPYLTHRNPQLFPNPRQFQPERFLTQSRKLPAGSYFPFGGGLRRCVGADLGLHEMKLLLGTLLGRLSLVRAGVDPLPPRPAWRFFSLAPSDGLPVIVTERLAHEVAPDELDLEAVAVAS